MKKFTGVVFLLAFLCSAGAQTPRYVLIEHFTNSNCSICAGKNPSFYNLIGQYQDAVHHVSVHPPVPYSSCVFYQANKVENSAWASQYGISSTPRVALNGTLVPLGGPLLGQATLEAALNQSSNLYLQVTESGSGANRSAELIVRTEGPLPSGDLRLFVAVLEKTVNQTTGNGETVHYDVFRDLLTDTAGMPFTPAAPGHELAFDFNYAVNAAWNPDEVYVLAYAKNITSGEVINSGTKFDPVISATGEAAVKSIRVSPNPATANVQVILPEGIALQSLQLFDLSGREHKIPYKYVQGSAALELSALKNGIYLLRITTDRGVTTRKLIRK